MARNIIDIGVQGNDGTGDSIRESFRKVNDNFTQLFAIFGDGDRIAFTDLDDTPNEYVADQIIVTNADGDALVGKNLIGGAGIVVDHTDPNQIRVIATDSSLSSDDKPVLGNHMNANNYVIAHVRDPSPNAAQLFENLHGIETTEDDIVITKGYADKKYLQTTGGTSAGTLVRIRNEPADVSGYTVTIEDWINGYALIPDHGFNNGINGAAYIYQQTGNFPASGLLNGQTYYLRLYNSDLLALYGTPSQATDDINFEATRIIVNDDPVAKEITSANSSTIAGTSTPTSFVFTDIPVVTVTGTGASATVSVVKNDSSFVYSGLNTTITFIETGEGYALGDSLKILGTSLGGTSPANDLTFNLVSTYRGDETLVDEGYDAELEGNWLGNEALPRKSTVRRQGDDMEGALYLHDHPGSLAGVGNPNGPDDLQAATKFYVDSSSFASATNLFVATSGDDSQRNTPPGKEGRAFSYAYATIGAACSKAEEIINQSLLEPGPYRQQLTYLNNAFPAYIESITTGLDSRRTLSIFSQLSGIDQSKDIDNRDLREGSILKGLRSGATGKVIQYIPPGGGQQDTYVVELLHTTTDITTFQSGYLKSSERLLSNLEFIGEEVIQFISAKYPSFLYNEETCKRDAELIVNAIAFDIKFGGNRKSIEAGRSYWRGVSRVLPTEQLDETIEGIEYILQLAEEIIQNNEIPDAPNPLAFGKRGDIDQDTTTGDIGELESFALIERMINLIIDIIENGPNGSGEFLEFFEDEYLEFGQPVPEVQISIRVETGVYYEQLPIRIPSNVSIKGDEFRRSIIRPAPGQSTSPWTNMFFRRDSEFDGILKEYLSDTGAASSSGDVITLSSGNITDLVKFGMNVYLVNGAGILDSLTTVTELINSTSFRVSPAPTTALSLATIRALNASGIAPTGVEFGYHYLKDPTGKAGIFDTTIAKTSGNTTAAGAMTASKTTLQSSVISYINSTYGSDFMTVAQKALCARDVGLIIDAMVYDITNGGTSRTENAGHAYRRNPSARIAITTQLVETLAALDYLKTLLNSLLSPFPSASIIVQDLVNGIQNIIRGENNPPKDNKDMDVFLLNDGCIIRNVTAQGHGGFMCVLDPEGQIQTKSPYFQTCTSLSGSINAQRFAGGMFVDGFCGNLPSFISGKTSNTQLQLGGLIYRKPLVPTSFYITGARYQINTIENWNPITGTADVLLDSSTPYTDSYTAPINVEVETPGNRSMLSNDFTQVNDLGYGLIATNNGISEAVSEFTYYNWTSYYSLNGGQIRSVTGSSCNGIYGLRARGSDPREVPDVVTLGDATLQQAKIYRAGSLLSKNVKGESSFYIEDYWYKPFGTSEVEIDHTPTRSSLIDTSLVITNGGTGYSVDDLLTATGGLVEFGASPTLLVVTEVDNGTPGGPGVITEVSVGDPGLYVSSSPITFTESPVGTYPTTFGTINVTGGAGSAATFTGTYLGSRSIYEISTIETTTISGVFKLNLDTGGAVGTSAPALTADLFHGQIITIRALQNLRFTDVAEVRPVRPSTALEFTGVAGGNQVLRTLNYNLSDSTGVVLPANQAILNFDQNVDYVLLDVEPDELSGGYGSAAGNTKLAIIPIAGAKLARVQSGELIFPHDGRMHLITGYSPEGTDGVGTPAYITFTNLPFGSGTTLDPSLDGIATGLRSGFTNVRNTTLRAGLQTGTSAKITVRISTCRATGHDFLDVGSGGFNSTNYPNNLYGAPQPPGPNKVNEVIEETQGRVFHVSTDQNGIFQVGKFFQVDQGTGNVTFNAAITLTDLNGLGFKKGTFVTEFSTDPSLGGDSPSSNIVSVQTAVRGYIDSRLGLVHDTSTPASNPIGPGYLPLDGSLPLSGDLNMGAGGTPHKIINVAGPGSDPSAAANKNYVDTEVARYDSLDELKGVNLMTPIAADVALFTGAGKILMSGGFGGDVTATLDSTHKTTLIGGITNAPSIDAGIVGTAQLNVSGGIEVADITGFPSSGYIQIGNEVFTYTGTTKTTSPTVTNRFDNVLRAQVESIATTHAALAEVKSLNAAFINLQIAAETIVNNDVSPTAAIAQSKINLTDVTDYVDIATTSSVGTASFSSDNFAVSVAGEVTIANGGVALAEIQNIAAGSILGNLTAGSAAPAEVSTSNLVTNGINTLFTSEDAGANVMTRRVNSLKVSPSSTFTSITGSPISGTGTITGVPVTSITGVGNGARVNVTYSGGFYTGVVVNYGGNGYAEGNQLKVDGRLLGLGGTSPANDLTFTIASTGSNIDTTVYLGLQKVSTTAEANTIVRTDNSKNLGTAGNKFNNIFSDMFTGNVTGTSDLAVDISGGTTGVIVYQDGVSSTNFLPSGSNGQLLKSNGVGVAPEWVTIAAGFSGDAGDLTGDTLASNVLTSSLTSVGTLSNLSVSGLVKLSVATGLTATGTTQATALELTSQINTVTTIATNTGVRLPNTAPVGYRIIVRNAVDGTTLRVYPPPGAQINTLGNNTVFPLTDGALEFVCESATQWFTLTSTFG